LLLSAQEGKRVLLVDVDMRKGYIHQSYNQNHEQGMSELLAGTLPVADAIRSSGFENLDLITRGVIPKNPSELLMSPNMGKFIEQVSADYDLVILDTPPILAVTDPAVIGAYASTSLLVARYEQCTKKQVERALHRFELSGVKINGMIFNMIERRPSSYYYDTGYYHYEYRS
jgi:tyrosine-protein kinase Etk/Wzc